MPFKTELTGVSRNAVHWIVVERLDRCRAAPVSDDMPPADLPGDELVQGSRRSNKNVGDGAAEAEPDQ